MNVFEFAVLSGLRAEQLVRGCTPRLEPSAKRVITAQREVAERLVVRSPAVPKDGETVEAIAEASGIS
jgi:DNA-directed RNA polymerase subunit K/omega